MRRLVSVVAAAAVGAVLVVSPAEAMPVRAFGAPTSVSTGSVDVYGLTQAVLPDGTVGVAWTEGSTSVHLAVRRPGTNLFTELTPLAMESGYSVSVPGLPSLWPPVTLRAAGAEFLLGWGEAGATPRLRVSRVPANASAVPPPVTVSGPDGMENGLAYDFNTASDGSAVAVWFKSGPFGQQVRAARRAGLTGAWQQLGTAGTVSFPYDVTAAIDSSRSVTVGWAAPNGIGIGSRVRSYQGGAWGLAVIAGAVSATFSGSMRLLSASSSGAATVVAFVDTAPGASLFAVDSTARGVRVLTRPTAGAPWALSGPLLGPGRFAFTPAAAMAPDGSAVVSFLDARSGSGTAVGVASMVAQRRGSTGAWGPALAARSVATDSSGLAAMIGGRLTPGLAPDGTLVVPAAAPVSAGSGTMAQSGATAWRPGWTAPFTSQTVFSGTPILSFPTLAPVVVDPAGRATVAFVGGSPPAVTIATTALPAPLARSRAALSTSSPRVGSAVTCVSAWTGAKTLAFRWQRSGVTIAGATAQSYTPKPADAGRTLTCRVTATNPTGSTVSTSVGRAVR